jgi:hypothetical protein
MRSGRGRVPTVQSKAVHTFAKVPSVSIPRSVFDRSHGYKTTFNEGYLVPVYVDEILPGDTFNLKLTAFSRLATPINPIMDNMYMETFFFFVPNRLIWTNWERFNGEQDNPADSTAFTTPQLVAPAVTGVVANTLGDYLGLPTAVASISVSALPWRAYNLIWNDWFRDENMQGSAIVQMDNGPDTYANYQLLRRGKRHDYFTSALPWPQKINDGSTVTIPLTGNAPVVRNANAAAWKFYRAGTQTLETTAGAIVTDATAQVANAVSGLYQSLDPMGGLTADLTAVTGVSINALRQAVQMQRLFERDARGGTRYTETIRAHFGVISPDMRLQRPEYLGGGSTPVNITPIPQTSESATTPQGNLAAYGTCAVNNHGFVKSFTEHGWIIGIVSVRADLNYQQGLNRMWSRSTRYDYYWPVLAHLGEQSILNKEIFMDGSGNDNNVFGYQERYAEYRYKPAQITGEFRSNFATPLDSWHLAQQFGALPTLNNQFISENAPVARIIAVNTAPHFLFDGFFSLKCARPMPLYSVPGLMDHF